MLECHRSVCMRQQLTVDSVLMLLQNSDIKSEQDLKLDEFIGPLCATLLIVAHLKDIYTSLNFMNN